MFETFFESGFLRFFLLLFCVLFIVLIFVKNVMLCKKFTVHNEVYKRNVHNAIRSGLLADELNDKKAPYEAYVLLTQARAELVATSNIVGGPTELEALTNVKINELLTLMDKQEMKIRTSLVEIGVHVPNVILHTMRAITTVPKADPSSPQENPRLRQQPDDFVVL
jgi:hypothetical protein